MYTTAGAFIGFAAQRLGNIPNFEQWQRYAGIVAGMVIMGLAVRTAATVRTSLACKMPMLSKIPVISKLAHTRREFNPLELMFAGVAFATGCMTCFGAAIVIGMVAYVGLSSSAAFGALTLFLFSLGMGIPLVIGAIAISKMLPMLVRLTKFIPWMGLSASVRMTGFAILLITGNYMAMAEWVNRFIPAATLK